MKKLLGGRGGQEGVGGRGGQEGEGERRGGLGGWRGRWGVVGVGGRGVVVVVGRGVVVGGRGGGGGGGRGRGRGRGGLEGRGGVVVVGGGRGGGGGRERGGFKNIQFFFIEDPDPDVFVGSGSDQKSFGSATLLKQLGPRLVERACLLLTWTSVSLLSVSASLSTATQLELSRLRAMKSEQRRLRSLIWRKFVASSRSWTFSSVTFVWPAQR